MSIEFFKNIETYQQLCRLIRRYGFLTVLDHAMNIVVIEDDEDEDLKPRYSELNESIRAQAHLVFTMEFPMEWCF